MMKLTELTHPLIQHKITMLRDNQTGIKEFRELVQEISMLMWYEVTRELPTKEITIQTPIAETNSKVISGVKLALIPLLRSGITMASGIEGIMPAIKIGHIGVYRQKDTLEPKVYYCKLPTDIERSTAVILEPMPASGASVCSAIQILKERGVKDIKVMSLIASRQAVESIAEQYPETEMFVCAVDEDVNEQGYIVPGFGDAGDRMYGTK